MSQGFSGGYGSSDGFVPPGERAPLPWSATDAIGFGWTAVTSDYVNVALPLVVLTVAMVVINGIVGAIVGAVVGIVSAIVSSASGEGGNPAAVQLIRSVADLVNQFLNMIVQALFVGGGIEFSIATVRGKRPPFATIFSGPKYFVPLFINEFLTTIAVLLGCFCLIFPGIYLILSFCFAAYLAVDRRLGGIEALSAGWKLAKGQRVNIFLLLLLGVLIAFAGALLCFLPLLFLSVPIIHLAIAYAFLKVTGEEPVLPQQVR